jgi:D-alanyl-lipoteichoic acid acyltransferase DltB (MBOAT superfamily)
MDRPASPPPVDPRSAALSARPLDSWRDQTQWLVGPIARYLALGAQLTLFVAIVYLFSIESRAFLHLSLLTLGGFLVHQVLPLALRLPFFLALSFGGIVLVMGPANALPLIGIGLLLIGTCHLPIAFRWRVALLVALGAALAAARAGLVPVPWSAAVWPILGSLFMFRLIVYLYDLSHDKAPVSPVRSLAYFFLLPNVCFPLFPVVDYKTFKRTYYDADADRIYQTGMQWILRGTIHLLLYRLVYYHATIAPSEVANPGDLARYLTTNFLLYLRVSGQFHLVIGMLHLFGFNLPETNHRWLLASSFTDFWRRINIYWKDFMMKVFYYPAFFRLRKQGATRGLVLATLFVFFATWILHSYQWFWLRGSFPITWQDGIFWGVLAALVVFNSLREASRGRARTLGKRTASPRELAVTGLRTVGTFAAICVLWSIWTSASMEQWLSLWVNAFAGPAQTAAAPAPPIWLFAAVPAALRVGPAGRAAAAGAGPGGLLRSMLIGVLCFLGLAALGHPRIYPVLGSTVAGYVDSVRQARLSDADAAQLERGYYENLMDVDRFNSQLWEVYMKQPADWQLLHKTPAVRLTRDFQKLELVPNVAITFQNHPLRTNGFGMRDRDYAQHRPPGTFRAALLGSSQVLGSGVGDGENFESLLEERLAAEPISPAFARYELLNFAVSGYGPLQELGVLERALGFEPQAVFLVAHALDRSLVVSHLVEAVRFKVAIPHAFLRERLARAGVDAGTPGAVARRRLEPYADEMLRWTYAQIAETARAHGATPVWIFLPLPQEYIPDATIAAMEETARSAGFATLSLRGVYDSFELEEIQVAPWDNHPNARGHRAVAERLYAELAAHPAVFENAIQSAARPRKEK